MPNKVQNTDYWIDRPLDDPYRDWATDSPNWISEYWQSANHPHRQLIMDSLLELYPFDNILEIGCNTGPNLKRIYDLAPEIPLAGLDVNKDTIERAKLLLPKASLKVGSVLDIPFNNNFDVVISDAVLLYISPQEIQQALAELNRVTRRALILIERYAASLEGEVVGHVWGRDYKTLFENLGFKVKEQQITKIEWPTSENWIKYGRSYLAVRA